MKLSDHFTLEELTVSETAVRKGLDNTPSLEIIENLKKLASSLEVVRAILGFPIHINSGYRSLAVNIAIGGSKTSAHMQGYAADFVCPQFGKPIDIVKKLANTKLAFDQLIQEGNWVHISFDPKMRHQVLTANFINGKAQYVNGIQETKYE